jgi:hypothetical protein
MGIATKKVNCSKLSKSLIRSKTIVIGFESRRGYQSERVEHVYYSETLTLTSS